MPYQKYRRIILQTLTFGLIWLVFGIVYVFIEAGIINRQTIYWETNIKYDLQISLIIIGIGSFLSGLIQGWIEVTWLRKKLSKFPFWLKILLKNVFYITFVVLFLLILTLISNANRFDLSILDPEVNKSLWEFMNSFAFWSIVIFVGVILEVGLFYSEMTEYLGTEALYNYSFGKYHNPKQETRIFMFLDMKSSTTIAEKMGHVKYFELLKDYYGDMTDAILETSGRIYQYVGDEIVVTWTKKDGVFNNNCIQCFSIICKTIGENKRRYMERYGAIPEFKAGFHLGEVTAGQIGIIKKDIVYTGDVLNTTARIQAECNTYNTGILLSAELKEELQKDNMGNYTTIGELFLRGKTKAIRLYSLEL